MIGYASRTGTKRNLDALRAHGWRILVSATGPLRPEGFPYALDNGAWTAFQAGQPFNEKKFTTALRKLGRNADWTAVPDIVAGGLASLEMSLRWLRVVLDECERGLIPVQDGMTEADVRHLIGRRVGIFVGGSTPWKLRMISRWGALARELGVWCHVGRVNTKKRIALCGGAGVTSFDGTSPSRYSKNLPRLDGARRQMSFILGDP